jgi:hypothetical protein
MLILLPNISRPAATPPREAIPSLSEGPLAERSVASDPELLIMMPLLLMSLPVATPPSGVTCAGLLASVFPAAHMPSPGTAILKPASD